MKERIAQNINVLGEFCGKRDIPFLNKEELKKRYSVSQVDVMVLFGGSIICGGDVLAEAMKADIAKKYVIVGGAGHTIVQDATMQHRMEAVLRKYISHDITIINFASYNAKVIVKDNELIYENDIFGMWDIERYITLLMGEVPRLSDNINGYGPKGKNFIAHVDIPHEVHHAFSELKKEYAEMIREANPLYASKTQ